MERRVYQLFFRKRTKAYFAVLISKGSRLWNPADTMKLMIGSKPEITGRYPDVIIKVIRTWGDIKRCPSYFNEKELKREEVTLFNWKKK